MGLFASRHRLAPFLTLSGPDGSWLPTVAILLGYAGAFTALRHAAGLWDSGSFSLWFPAAGLRFAFLWRFGPRIAPAASVAELVVQLASRTNGLGPTPMLGLTGIVGPCLVYGAVIHLVRAHAPEPPAGRPPSPLPFALAAIIGPAAACLAALPWAIPLALENGPFDSKALFLTLLVFTLGDMLGVLLVAPPLVWLANKLGAKRRLSVSLPEVKAIVEAGAVFVVGWTLVALIAWAGLGLMLAPLLLATCWVGLRVGRAGAWIAIVLVAAFVLPFTSDVAVQANRLEMHMMLACIAAAGYLAGSYSEAEDRARREIRRRDKILLQADRLKTLRAMSVAVIHEISQPLSILSIESNNLVAESLKPRVDPKGMREGAALIARKALDLSNLVRRLRQFGERTADARGRIPVGVLFNDVREIALPHAAEAGITLRFTEQNPAVVVGDDVELRQALLNLLRNAISAAPRGDTVTVASSIEGSQVRIAIDNHCDPTDRVRPGMGIGLIIARAIATAHDGAIDEQRCGPNHVRFVLALPFAGVNNG